MGLTIIVHAWATLQKTRQLKTARGHMMPPPLHLPGFYCKIYYVFVPALHGKQNRTDK